MFFPYNKPRYIIRFFLYKISLETTIWQLLPATDRAGKNVKKNTHTQNWISFTQHLLLKACRRVPQYQIHFKLAPFSLWRAYKNSLTVRASPGAAAKVLKPPLPLQGSTRCEFHFWETWVFQMCWGSYCTLESPAAAWPHNRSKRSFSPDLCGKDMAVAQKICCTLILSRNAL